MIFQERAAQAIRDSGGRMTQQRVILLDVLASIENEIDAERLYQLASAIDSGISLPTIYRTLNTLEDAQLISAHYISSDHQRKQYRIAPKPDSFHFTCRRCGRVQAIESALVDTLRDDFTARYGLTIQSLCMCVGGLCADCHGKEDS